MASHIWIGGAPAIAQVDTITIPSSVEAGQVFTATIGRKTLTYTVLSGATATTVAAAIVSLWNLSDIPEFAEVTAVDNEDGSFTLTSDTAGVPFVVTTMIGSGTNEKQVIILSSTATGGTFTLSYGGQTTGNIAYNASAGTVETAFEGLSTVGSGNGTVTGSGPWTIEFTGTLAGTDATPITADASGLTGGQNEKQTITFTNSPTGGTFRLSFLGELTGTIAYNASAGTVETALLALNSIPPGSVSCTGGALPGTAVVVEFTGHFAGTDVALLVVDNDGLTGISATPTTSAAGGSALQAVTEGYWDFETNTYIEPGAEDSTEESRVGTTTDASSNALVLSESRGLTGSLYGIPYGFYQSEAGGYLDNGLSNYGRNALVAGATTVGAYDEDEGFSLAIAFKCTSQLGSQRQMLISKGSAYTLEIDASGDIKFTAPGGHTVTTSVASISEDTYHHVVAVYDPDNTDIRISVDGAAFEETTSLTIGSDSGSAGTFSILDTSAALQFYGYIDSVGIFNRALTISEAQELYNSGNGDDYPFPSGAGTNEIQSLAVAGTPSVGTIDITFGVSTVTANYNSSAAQLQTLFDSMDSIGAGNSYVSGGPWPGTALTVEFIGELGITGVALLALDVQGLLGSAATTQTPLITPTITITTPSVPVTQTSTTSSSGPNDWGVAANFSTNTVPVTGDTVYIADTDVSILYGLDQSAVTLAALHVEQTFTGFIGLARVNTDGTSSYFEYRDAYLQIGATLLNIGDKDGDGSERIKINLGSVQSTVLITDSGESPDGNTPPILLLGTHASNVINVNRGTVGVAYYPTEVSTIATLRQAFFDDAADDTTVFLGTGVTVADIVKTGGVLDINSDTTSFKQSAGTTTVHAGAHTVLNILAGLLNYNSTGTLSAVNLSGDAVLVFDQDARPKTVTVIDKYTDESEIYDESGSIATPVIDLNNCGDLSTLHMGQNFKVTIGATS